MKAQSPPSKIARLADSGMGSMGGEDSPETGLGLELGPRPNHGKSGFTFLQLEELENQVLIFKYIVAGVPVPFQLVFPIWKSVSSSFGGGNGGIYQHYPSFLGCSPASFDYRNSMEPEPGRCRRTDGKKWRCSKDVVPDQKYCERHMHRGRQRSRKHVEASQITTATSSSINNTKNSAVNSNTSLSGSIPVSLELMTNINNNRISNTNINTTNNNNSIVSPRLGFSPKSVLQVLGCRNLCFDFIDSMEPEASRCRRTDGRKWQCNRDVVPDQKYCERHVHRGRQSSRKHVETSQLATNTTTTIAKNTNNNLLNSNTNFSIYQ